MKDQKQLRVQQTQKQEPECLRDIPSQFLNQYSNIISEVSNSFNHQDAVTLFAQHRIIYEPWKEFVKFSYSVLPFQGLNDVFLIKVKISKFELQLWVKQIDSTNPFQKSQRVKGNYGEVFFTEFQGEEVAIKSTKFENQLDFFKKIPLIIKEWSLLKICSVLKCTPSLQTYFGYDLIVYSDSIQFAIQMGNSSQVFDSKDSLQLISSLSILHKICIIHGDIKPGNVVFSFRLRKWVFIDFGFAQIISEQLGFKTLSEFKGTPDFCSPQMIQLLPSKEGYIDLYYNDAYALLKTFDLLKTFIEKPLVLEYATDIEQSQLQRRTLLKFSYYYIQIDTNKALKTLNFDEDICHAIISKVLTFIKESYFAVFDQQLFFGGLQKYCELPQYIQIKKSIKEKFIWFPKHSDNLENLYQNNSKLRQLFQKANDQIDSGNSSSSKYEHYYLLITAEKKSHKFSTKDDILSVSFQSVRFDVKNLSLSKKSDVSKYICSSIFMVSVSKKQSVSQHSEEAYLFYICQFLLMLVQYCLQQPATIWKKRIIVEVVYQCIICRCQIELFFQKFLIFIDKNLEENQQKLIAVLSFVQWIDFFKQNLGLYHVKFSQLYLESFMDFTLKMTKNCLQLLKNSSNHQQLCYYEVITLLRQKQLSENNKQILTKKIKNMKNQALRKFFRFELIMYLIFFDINSSNFEKAVSLTLFINKNMDDFIRVSLHTYVHINIKILNALKNKFQVMEFHKLLMQIIDSKYITEILYPSEEFEVTKIQKSIEKLRILSLNTSLLVQKSSLQYFLYELVQMLELSKYQMSPQTWTQFKKVCSYLQQLTLSRSEDVPFYEYKQYFDRVYSRLRIAYFYLVQCKENYQWLISSKLIKNFLTICNIEPLRVFQTLLQQYLMAKYNHNKFECELLLHEMAKHCKHNGIIQYALNFWKQCFGIAQSRGNFQDEYKYLLQIYDMCSKGSIILYFQLGNEIIFMNTLYAFLNCDKLLAYQFLAHTLSFLNQCPLDGYIRQFTMQYSEFYRMQMGQGLKFDCKEIKAYFSRLPYNPYHVLIQFIIAVQAQQRPLIQKSIRAMAVEFDKVNRHFIVPILPKYYLLFFQKMNISERKQRHLNYRLADQHILHILQVELPIFKNNYRKNMFRSKLHKYWHNFVLMSK